MYKFTFKINEQDIFNSTMNYNKSRITFLFDIVFTLTSIGVTAYNIINKNFFNFNLFYQLLLIFCCLLFPVVQPILTYIKSLSHAKKLKNIEITMEFTEDRIKLSSSNDTTEVLYENIYNLQNEESLTFLYRAPKFEMKPLNSKLIAKEYKNVFGIGDDKAGEMAKLVKGYPYAYQFLGYLCYKNNAGYEDVIEEFDVYLEEYVYEKIWSEMSDKDRLVIGAIASIDERKCSNIRGKLNMEPGDFSVYRDRLLKKGLVTKPKYGYLDLTLPRFKKFIIEKYL